MNAEQFDLVCDRAYAMVCEGEIDAMTLKADVLKQLAGNVRMLNETYDAKSVWRKAGDASLVKAAKERGLVK